MQVCIAQGRLGLGVAQHRANFSQFGPGADQNAGKGMTQIVDTQIRDPGNLANAFERAAQFRLGFVCTATRKQNVPGPDFEHPAQYRKRRWIERRAMGAPLFGGRSGFFPQMP